MPYSFKRLCIMLACVIGSIVFTEYLKSMLNQFGVAVELLDSGKQ
jgi:hypothetical protein